MDRQTKCMLFAKNSSINSNTSYLRYDNTARAPEIWSWRQCWYLRITDELWQIEPTASVFAAQRSTAADAWSWGTAQLRSCSDLHAPQISEALPPNITWAELEDGQNQPADGELIDVIKLMTSVARDEIILPSWWAAKRSNTKSNHCIQAPSYATRRPWKCASGVWEHAKVTSS